MQKSGQGCGKGLLQSQYFILLLIIILILLLIIIISSSLHVCLQACDMHKGVLWQSTWLRQVREAFIWSKGIQLSWWERHGYKGVRELVTLCLKYKRKGTVNATSRWLLLLFFWFSLRAGSTKWCPPHSAIGLATSVKPPWRLPHRHTRRHVS